MFAAQHLIYLLPVVFLFLTLRAAALLHLGELAVWLVAAAVAIGAGRWAGPRLDAVAWAQIPGAFGRRRREATPWPPVAGDYAAALVKAVVIVVLGWWVTTAPSDGAPLLAGFFTAYMAAALTTTAFLNARTTAPGPGTGWTAVRAITIASFAVVAVLALSNTAHQGMSITLALLGSAFGLGVGSMVARARA